jgi:hypothetical protein
MSMTEVSLAAAVAVLGVNLLANSPHRQSARRRRLTAVGLAGSAAAGDSEVSILINQTEVGRLFNSATGFPDRFDLMAIGEDVPSNSEISAVVVDAPATNPLNLLIEFTD